jgi:hypothetical protein
MNDDTPKWVIALIVAILVVGLIAFARGRTHHRGDEVGSQAAAVPIVSFVAW